MLTSAHLWKFTVGVIEMDYGAVKIKHIFIPKVRGDKAPESQDGNTSQMQGGNPTLASKGI